MAAGSATGEGGSGGGGGEKEAGVSGAEEGRPLVTTARSMVR